MQATVLTSGRRAQLPRSQTTSVVQLNTSAHLVRSIASLSQSHDEFTHVGRCRPLHRRCSTGLAPHCHGRAPLSFGSVACCFRRAERAILCILACALAAYAYDAHDQRGHKQHWSHDSGEPAHGTRPMATGSSIGCSAQWRVGRHPQRTHRRPDRFAARTADLRTEAPEADVPPAS